MQSVFKVNGLMVKQIFMQHIFSLSVLYKTLMKLITHAVAEQGA